MPSAAFSGSTKVSNVRFCFFGCSTAALNCWFSILFVDADTSAVEWLTQQVFIDVCTNFWSKFDAHRCNLNCWHCKRIECISNLMFTMFVYNLISNWQSWQLCECNVWKYDVSSASSSIYYQQCYLTTCNYHAIHLLYKKKKKKQDVLTKKREKKWKQQLVRVLHQ